MKFQELEEIFNRAWRFAFSKLKFLIVFTFLLACGVLIVFCKTLSFSSGPWLVMSLSFLPVFLCTGLLLACGVLLMRIYYHEIKGGSITFKKLILDSFEVFMSAAYLSVPLALSYLFLWTLMGVFYLLKSLPMIGEGLSVLLSFGPFLIVLASLLLGLFSLLTLFFVTPHLAMKKKVHFLVAEEILARLSSSPFKNLVLLAVALLPLLICISFLTASAFLTGLSYVSANATITVSLQWFFIMIPFALLLTPFVVFFFNFSLESYALSKIRMKREVEEEPCRSPS
jgi:hypothetical protein